MDKLQLVIEYTRNMLRAGADPKEINTSHIYDLIEKIENQGVDRGIIQNIICDLCHEKVVFLDVSTLGDAEFKAHCKCRCGSGKTKILALHEWRMQPEGLNRGY